jgi:hypothetical protein
MADTIKVRMKVSHGSPVDGAIIRAGAVVPLPEFWAKKFISDGTAEEVKTEAAHPAAKEKKNGGKTPKGKN